MHPTISQKRYLAAAQVFHWATQDHFTLWFTGEVKRSKRTEVILPRLVKKGALVAVKHGKRLIYACPRRSRHTEFDHGLGCTEGLIRFWWSDMRAEIIEERFFAGCGQIPEWGLRYNTGKMILFEYCTADNFKRKHLMKSKLTGYQQHLDTINRKFNRECIIVFVCDVDRAKLLNFVMDMKPTGLPVFFTDYEMFKRIGISQQLAAPIYIWGEDGLSYPLVTHAQPPHS